MDTVEALLYEWGMKPELVQKFVDSDIDLFALEHMEDETVKQLIPTPGQQIRFIAKRNLWLKKKQVESTLTTNDISTASSVICAIDLNGNLQVIPDVVADDHEVVNNNAQENTPSMDVNTQRTDTINPSSGDDSVRVSPSRTTKKHKTYDLHSILKTSTSGHCVLSKYGLNSSEGERENNQPELDEAHRNKLAWVVIEEELRGEPSKRLSKERMEFLAARIIELFSTESKVCISIDLVGSRLKGDTRHSDHRVGLYHAGLEICGPTGMLETYVISSVVNGKQILKGKLYWQYYNARRRYKSSGLIARASKDQAKQRTTSGAFLPDPETEGNLLWRTQNISEWKDVVELWKNTAKARRRKLKEDGEKPLYMYTDMFPALKEKEGYRLLELDFLAKKKTADKKMALFKAWPRLSSFVIKIVKEKIPHFLEDSVYTADEKILKVLLNMASLFQTVTVSRGKRTKGGKQWRPTQIECQEAFLLHIENISLLHEKMEARRNKMASLGLTLQPQAVIVGPVEDIRQSLVVIDNYHYEIDSPLAAIDMAFKTYHALDTPYPPEAEQLWHFIQIAVYGFTTKSDKTFTSVATRIAEFKRH